MLASVLRTSRRRNEARTYCETEATSSPMKMVMRSRPAAIAIMPLVARRMSA